MSLADTAHNLLGGDILLRLRADATGLDTDVSAKLTQAERAAETSAGRIGASSARSVQAAEKVQVAQLRATAAEERYNAVLLSEEKNTARLASAQAALITARGRASKAQAEQAALAQRSQRASLGIGSTVGLLAATYGVVKLAQAYRAGVSAAERLQSVEKQTNAELKAGGDISGVTAGHIRGLAEQVAHYSGTQDTAVQGAANLLLNFKGISKQTVFDRAVKSAEDLAVSTHNARGGLIDVAGQAKALGLALNDPATGLDRLRRSGIAFTAQQKAQVKALAESGQTLKAQTLILDLIDRKVGGSAKAFGDTAEGQAQRAKVAYEELSRTLAIALLPAVTKVERALTETAQFFGEHKGITDTALAIGGLTAGVFLLVKAEQAYQALRKSELLGIGARLLGYRSLERAQVQLAAAEDRHAEAAGRVAEAETVATRATVGSAIAAEESAGAQTAASGGRAGLLSRIFRRSAGVAEGAGGATAARAGLLGAVAFPAAAAVVGGLGVASAIRSSQRYSKGQDLVDQLLRTQQTLSRNGVGPGVLGKISDSVSAVNSGGAGGFLGLGGSTTAMQNAQRLLSSLDMTYSRYLGHVSATSQALDRETYGHRAVILAYQQERDAIFETDLARANSVQARADADRKAYQNALAFQHQVAAGQAKAVQTVEQQIGVSAAGLFDPIVKAKGGTAGASPYAIDSARASVASAASRAQLDEQKLTALRGKDTTTALQLSSAETALAGARASQRLAQERLSVAEGKGSAARSTALSVATILKRATAQASAQGATADEARTLVRKGITEPVLQGLYALDQKAPGTFANVAAHITAAGVRQLNRDERLKEAARRGLEVAFAAANTKSARIAAANSADLAAKAWQTAYAAALKSPEFWLSLQTDLGKLLVGNLGVLPKDNAPGTGNRGKAPSVGGILRGGLPGQPNINFNGPVTFTDPKAASSKAARAKARQHALSGGVGGFGA